MVTYKTVDVITEKPIRNISVPINSSAFGVKLPISDIHECILQKAVVLEILPDGRKIKLDLTNYKNDNIIGDDDIPPYNGKIDSFPFISNILEKDKDTPYLVTGNAIKKYILEYGQSATGETLFSIDGGSFTQQKAIIRFRRGLESELPILKPGEPAISIDNGKLYIGGMAETNISIPTEIDMTNMSIRINDLKNLIDGIDIATLTQLLTNKVDKVEGKDLSSNDYTNIDKQEVIKIKDKADFATVNALATTVNNMQDQINLIMNLLGGGGTTPFAITLDCNTSVVEKGNTLNNITFTWSYNKTIQSQQFEGESLDVNTRTYNYITPISTNKTFTLSAVSSQNETKTAIKSITFLNGIYYGVSSSITYDNTLINSLTKVLSETKGRTITVDAATETDYIYYCIPSRLGTISFNVGGFEGGFTKVNTIEFTNTFGYTESYDIYRSDNGGLGSTTVQIQ